MRSTLARRFVTRLLLGAALVLTAVPRPALAEGAPDANTVLIFGPTVFGGRKSLEATTAAELGFTVEVADGETWSMKSPADFATYRAIVFGDPRCESPSAVLDLPTRTGRVWVPAVTGNVIVAGTDPAYHSPFGFDPAETGGIALTRGAIAFAAAVPGATGAYVSLSCYYSGAPTPVPLLEELSPGGFIVAGALGSEECADDVHVVGSHPTLAAVDDETLSDWQCSVHEVFERWPADYRVVAIARDLGAAFRGADGVVGTPYIVARSREVRGFSVSLTPPSATNVVGTSHTVTAEFTDALGRPLAGFPTGFVVTDGPNAGQACAPADCLTDAAGRASFSWTGTGGPGTDTVLAFVDANESGAVDPDELQATATKTWITPCGDGVVDAGEQCDDGNTVAGDCCAADCTLEADGGSCDDGDASTTGDVCRAGGCAGAQATVAFTPTPRAARIECVVDPASGTGTGLCSAVGFVEEAAAFGPATAGGERAAQGAQVQVTRRVERRLGKRKRRVVFRLKLNRLGRQLLRQRQTLDVRVEIRVTDRAGREGQLLQLLRLSRGR
jgi:cysteine-rich repeat protein